MSFHTEKVHDDKKYHRAQKRTRVRFFILIGFIVGCMSLISYFGLHIVAFTQDFGKQVSHGAIRVVSSVVGKEMIKDDFGHINVLIVGHGGIGHAGSYLADTIMVASFNPALGSVTMLSIPRDLYVMYTTGSYGKINATMAYAFNRTRTVTGAVDALREKIETILGLDIPYYFLVDFDGFVNLVDNLSGVNVYVKEDLVDRAYPNGRGGYEVFSVKEGRNTFDGATALKYARSRHSTSDFSRSLRQQDIIKSLMRKILSRQSLLSVSTLRTLYNDYQDMVTTNISLDEMLGLAQYEINLDKFFSFVFTTNCGYSTYKSMKPGCFLYTPDRDLFGGASVILPMGATPNRVQFYTYLQNFAFYVIHNQGYLIENPRIVVKNAIQKKPGQTLGRANGLATNIGVKLRKFGMNIQDVVNSDQFFDKTTVIVHRPDNEFPETIKTLKTLIHVSQVMTGDYLTGVDLSIMVGNDYVDILKNERFSFEM